tara:strand:+ start:188 stop:493 length:306 start_codon:yes stop_codon:yes gene_type:complete
MLEKHHDYMLRRMKEEQAKINELFIITAEECSEVSKECMKALRFGNTIERRSILREEIGDLQCMINLMIEYNICTKEEIDNQVEAKKSKLKEWSSLINDDR